ncbi:chemokine-like protein TAFA-5 [Huso huso]|uniref:Chemokine-like protein TAFA-5 n=1 Tax=Huso huso TaxID=61971 RepID=A0ABR0YDS2_HUSHU
MQAGLRALFAGTGASLCCLFLLWVIYSHLLKEGKVLLAPCSIVMGGGKLRWLHKNSAGLTNKAKLKAGQYICLSTRIVKNKQWCEMAPCSEGEICGLLLNRSGWTCTKGGGRIKTVTVSFLQCSFTFVV